MNTGLPRAFRRRLDAASLTVVLLALTACSSSSSPDASLPGASSTIEAPTVAAPESRSASPSPDLAVGLDLPDTWMTDSLIETGEGYGMSLTTTSDPDLFDARLFRREADGAITDQQIIAILVVSPTEVEITWPDGGRLPGLISEVDGEAVEIDLGEGCLTSLAADVTTADCILVPHSEELLPPPDPEEIPTQDEAMGYLCSVGVEELTDVVDSSADPFSTSVLQAALTTLGYDPGPIDGNYGRATRSAVRDFQSASGLTVDALVGPRTWTSLQAAACQLPEDPAQPGD